MTSGRDNTPVLDISGKTLGHVSKTATSVAASKIANAPCLLRRVNGLYCWQAKA